MSLVNTLELVLVPASSNAEPFW